MTSSQSANEERPAVAQAHMIQQMSREAQEMKRRRRRRFQSQVIVEEAVVRYYSRSCRQLPFLLLLTNLLAVAFISTVDESKLTTANVTVKNDGNQQMVRVQQMKRDQLLCKQALKQRESWISDDDISSDVITTSRYLVHADAREKRRRRGGNPVASYCSPADTVARYQQEATVYPDESFSVIFNHSRMHRKRCSLNKLIRHRLIYPVVGSPAASISLPPAGQPDASNSTSSRFSSGIFRMIFNHTISVSGALLVRQLRSEHVVKRESAAGRKMMYQSRATVDPVASFSAIAYPVDMVSRRKKSRSSEALQPGAKYSVVKVTSHSSSRHEPAAKQLTIYEELSKLDVNC
ncbi:double-stranded RNA-binding protein 4 [Dorcoceras hygrometricum]|nr:double-stranded RNA-binding protein 4 [Dorcoceras hygrometricum]